MVQNLINKIFKKLIKLNKNLNNFTIKYFRLKNNKLINTN